MTSSIDGVGAVRVGEVGLGGRGGVCAAVAREVGALGSGPLATLA